MKKIDEITPYLFEDNFIIALNKKWMKYCKDSIKFSVMIDKKSRLTLVGPVISSKKEIIDE